MRSNLSANFAVRLIAIFALTLLCHSAVVLAQQSQPQVAALVADSSPCGELLQHGIYDHFRSTFSNTSASKVNSEICQAYYHLQQDKQSGGVRASYSLFSGSVSYSREQLEIVGSMMCSSFTNNSFSDTQLSIVQDTISESAVAAYRECLALNSAGLKSKTIFREADQAQITFELTYVAPTGTLPQTTVNRIVVAPEGSLRCEGPLWDIQGQLNAVSTQSVAMSCTRAVAFEPFEFNGARLLAKAATISIFTTTGTINRNLAPIFVELPPEPLKVPVGSILPFVGTNDEAAKMRQYGWWPCDGSVVEDSQAAPEFRGKHTPNLIGRFLLGSQQPNKTSGKASHTIEDQEITVTADWFTTPKQDSGPLLGPAVNSSWSKYHRITSKGQVKGATIPTIPPAYSVIYLIKVK